ncbi:hypothetical protein C8J56DRAFT_1167112 [Mycena floridula]|nr:hypothetical protein C8J56DRAFT_1167112 [Mycena floridula]
MRSPAFTSFPGLLPLLLLWITHTFALSISFPQASVSVGTSVNYTWSTSGQNKTDAALSFFAVKARLNGTFAHSGTYELVQIPDPHDSDHTGEVNMPFPPPLQDGLYVLDAIIADPTNAKTGLLILASTNTFRIFNTDSSNQSPSSTITNQSPSNTITTLPRGHSRTAIIAGSVCGGVVLLLLLIGGLVVLARRRRRRSTSSNARSRPASRWHRSSKWNPDNMVLNNDAKPDKGKADRRSELTIEPYDLPMKMTMEQEKPEAGSPMTPTPPTVTFTTPPTQRQMQLRNELAERVTQLEQAMQVQATTSAVENSRLRAEVQWLRDHQESDWARGLTDEIPPSYLDAQFRLPRN